MREHYRSGGQNNIQEIDGTAGRRNHYFVMDLITRMMITGPLGEGEIGLKKARSIRDGWKRRFPAAALVYISKGSIYCRHLQGNIGKDIEHGAGDLTHEHQFKENKMDEMWLD